jgi:hypothetical protein
MPGLENYSAYGAAADAGYFPKSGYSSYGLESGGFEQKEKKPFTQGQRRRLNVAAMFMCLFVPWGIFVANFSLLSLPVHYENPGLAYMTVFLSLASICILGLFKCCAPRRHSEIDEKEPNWLQYMFLTSILAWVLAVGLGFLNYYVWLEPFEHMKHLNTYHDVDPMGTTGDQLMDAGSVSFVNGTRVDTSKAMAFKNMETYCVAPIKVPGTAPSVYDFWAVGLNCCKGTSTGTTFSCENAKSPHAKGGLRLMTSTDRPFYRLAVQQAEVAYNIKAAHPLFFTWEQDPNKTMYAWKTEAYTNFQS